MQLSAGRDASQGEGGVRYERHRPERTLLYQLVEEYYPAFEAQWAAEGKVLPDYVRREFEDFLQCGRLESGFYRVRCELAQLTHTIARRVGRFLQRQGLLESDAENSHLALDSVGDDSMAHLVGHSITYRIAMGPQTGRKVFTLKTLPACDPDDPLVGKTAGFSLHAGVAVKARERDKLERLCRYITRPAVSEKRLSLTAHGKVRYELKTPYRDGTTHVIFEPLDFIARLAALVPRPRVNLTRYHGVFAPNSAHRSQVTPAGRGRGKTPKAPGKEQQTTPGERHAAMTWAQRLKRVFPIDIETCSACGGAVKVIACIQDPAVIDKILTHLQQKGIPGPKDLLPQCRAPPAGLFD